MAAVRTATVTWSGDLASGAGSVSAGSSDTFTDLPVSWASRTEDAEGRTSPEELLAAAHASCYAMAFSGGLGRAGTPPDHLHVSAEVTFVTGEQILIGTRILWQHRLEVDFPKGTVTVERV